MSSLSIFSEIFENRRLIYKGKDIYFSLFVTIVVSLCLLLKVISVHDCCIVLHNSVCTLKPLVSALFPAIIGVLATIVAFLFAGMIFLISFHSDDKFMLELNHDNQKIYSMIVFLVRWMATIGSLGLIFSTSTILLLYMGYSIFTMLLFIVSVFLFVYTISSIFSLFSLLAYYGKIRLKYHSGI